MHGKRKEKIKKYSTTQHIPLGSIVNDTQQSQLTEQIYGILHIIHRSNNIRKSPKLNAK